MMNMEATVEKEQSASVAGSFLNEMVKINKKLSMSNWKCLYQLPHPIDSSTWCSKNTFEGTKRKLFVRVVSDTL